MIGFTLSEDQQQIRDLIHDFAEKEMIPIAAECDRTGRHPQEIIERFHQLGFLNLTMPEVYGGGGLGVMEKCLMFEELSWGCVGIATTIMANSLALEPLVIGGTHEQKKKWLVPFCAKPNLAAFCLSEPNAGSDAGGLSTSIVRDGNEYVLNGQKMWISNGDLASLYVVFATHDKSKRQKGISAIVVPAGTKGLHIGKHEEKMGQRASHTTSLTFEDCRVPVDNLFGGEGNGFKIAMETLSGARAAIGASATGLARRALEESIKYAKERKQFGQAISNFQAIQFMIADMAMKVETARLLVWKAAWMVDNGQKNPFLCSASKCYGSDIAMQVTTDAVQVFGGYGYSQEYPVEKLMRDAKLIQIYEGTNQIQRIVMARHLLG